MTGRARQEAALAPAAALLRQVVAESDHDPAAGRDVLDGVASRIGGFDLDGYRQVLSVRTQLRGDVALAWAGQVLDLIDGSGVPRRLGLAALAQPAITDSHRRSTGAYYTDFRLARYLANRTAHLSAVALTPSSTVIDTAAGTGMLLVALAERVGGNDPGALRDLVAHGLSAVDVDPACRAGALAAFASLTADLDAIAAVATRIRTADSLIAEGGLWQELGECARFDAVLGNPPWERLRITRHEHLLATGARRHYGADYEPEAQTGLAAHGQELDRIRRYVAGLGTRYAALGDRDIDLCYAFLALGLSLVKRGGSLGMLLPAGLIRSRGTKLLRDHLLANTAEVDMTVFHNRGRFFGIDTRVKFLAVCAQLVGGTGPGAGAGATIRLRHLARTRPGSAILEPPAVRIGFADLVVARPDLTVPEVASDSAWRLFRHLAARGSAPHDPAGPWAMRISRELDMTRDKPRLSRTGSQTSIPVVEGRMIHQYRSRAKTYVSGTGRTAIWRPVALGEADRVRPQFFADPGNLPDSASLDRVRRSRIGFCDIVGQTNERTLQAALIDAGRVCGNKVPTIEFLATTTAESRQREMLFLAVANSLIVDWLVRRIVTTSLNFFILLGLPLPALTPGSPAGHRLIELAEHLVAAETTPGVSVRQVAEYRAEIDVLVCAAYQVDVADLSLVLADFPLLDRGQPPLPGEKTSTVTADLLASVCGDLRATERYAAASNVGAVAYVPAEFSGSARPG